MNIQRPMQPHWAALKEINPEMYEKCIAWRDGITHDPIIPLREKELMMISMCCLIRFEAGLRTHVEYGLAEGLTKEEIYACASTAMLLGGIPVFRDSVLIINDVLAKKGVI